MHETECLGQGAGDFVQNRLADKQSKYPTLKKKGRHDSARFDNGPETIKFKGKSIRMPVVGWVKMREELRFSGKPLSATVSRTADRWFVSVPVQIQIPDHVVRESQIATGKNAIDMHFF